MQGWVLTVLGGSDTSPDGEAVGAHDGGHASDAQLAYLRVCGFGRGRAATVRPWVLTVLGGSDTGPDGEDVGTPYDVIQAFGLYQLAERGLRIDIAHGSDHYRPRLRETLEAQERIRALLDAGEVEL